jgi:hypothetical protein
MLGVLRAAVAKEFLVFDTLGGCTLAPEPKAGWLERFSHVGDHFTLGKAGDFINFLKGDPVGPGCPNDPIRTILGWFRFFHPGDRIAGLFGLHVVIT